VEEKQILYNEILGGGKGLRFLNVQLVLYILYTVLYTVAEVCRSRSTGVDSGKSWHFSTGAGAEPEVDIFY